MTPEVIGLAPGWLMGSKNRLAWILHIAGDGCWVWLALAMHVWVWLPWAVVFTVLNVRGFHRWHDRIDRCPAFRGAPDLSVPKVRFYELGDEQTYERKTIQ